MIAEKPALKRLWAVILSYGLYPGPDGLAANNFWCENCFLVAGTEPFTPFIQLSENKKMRRLRNSLAVLSAVFVLIASAAGANQLA